MLLAGRDPHDVSGTNLLYAIAPALNPAGASRDDQDLASVHSMLASPQARGLFHKVIAQSGGSRDSVLTTSRLEKGRHLRVQAGWLRGRGPRRAKGAARCDAVEHGLREAVGLL